jgi:hypothetical protein
MQDEVCLRHKRTLLSLPVLAESFRSHYTGEYFTHQSVCDVVNLCCYKTLQPRSQLHVTKRAAERNGLHLSEATETPRSGDVASHPDERTSTEATRELNSKQNI